jgi:predicted nucleic acid-binding protein
VYLLDTDSLSNLLDRRRHHPRLQARFLATPADQLWISIVSVEEILRGALDGIRQA